ncbi:hypothetical protein F4825DRAFT_152839 [Nemania diffusa]|nr:hypothetical protein F4825DRAFT_152839 [Nemania diffusa]
MSNFSELPTNGGSGPSQETAQITADFNGLSVSLAAEDDDAECFVEWLLHKTRQNWVMHHSELSEADYDSQYGSGPMVNAAFVNVTILATAECYPVWDEFEKQFHMYKLDPSVLKIPLLRYRRDTMPELSKWLPQMMNILFKLYSEYRSELVPAEYADASSEATRFEHFRILPLATQITVVARLRARLGCKPSFRRLGRCSLRPAWAQPWYQSTHIGIIKIINNRIRIVTFGFELEDRAEPALARLCSYIYRQKDCDKLREQLGTYVEVWDIDRSRSCSLPFLPDAYASPNVQSTSDEDEAVISPGTLSPRSMSPKKDKIWDLSWVYRPLDLSDIRGDGPFDVNDWHDMNYKMLRTLVRR